MSDSINLIRPDKVSLANHSKLTEQWVQSIIADDPSILGLGDLILKDKERIHPKAGRLDLLLQDQDSQRRYEVEIQLGEVDESHIIRTIEYWDIERKRYPQYDHCAVIVAEDITNRFLNVINLFNGLIPLIAIKMEAYRNGDDYWLNFTTVLHEASLGLVEEDEIKEVTDRSYWEKRGTAKTVALVDEALDLINGFTSGYELKYNAFYIGLTKDGRSDLFVLFRPQKLKTTMELRLEQTDEVDAMIERAGLDSMNYDNRWGRYRLRISKEDLRDNREVLSSLLRMAYGRVVRD